jgi:GNAT superfamily N-acetyltransferase
VRVIDCRVSSLEHPDAARMLRAYMTEMVDRYHGGPMPAWRVDEAMAEDPNDDLAVFLVAYRGAGPGGTEAVGCAGLRVLPAGIGEVKRMYVHPGARRGGVGRALLEALAGHARERGLGVLRLDTRSDLVEARALYVRHGFVEIPAYNDGPYAEHWYEKRLDGA